MSLYAGNCSEHVCTLLIGYRSGGTPGFYTSSGRVTEIAGRRRGSSACQRPSNLQALRVARRCSPVGFDRQHILAHPVGPLFSATTSIATMTGAQDQEPAPKPVTYDELTPEHKKKFSTTWICLYHDIGSLKPMQESSRGADHGSDLCYTCLCMQETVWSTSAPS